MTVCPRIHNSDLLFHVQAYSNSFDQNVIKSSKEEDEGEHTGPLGNHLLVFAQNL